MAELENKLLKDIGSDTITSTSGVKQISYHICDFLITEEGEIFILEFGNAIQNSNFDGRYYHNKIDPKFLIQTHIKQFGALDETLCPGKSITHLQKRMSSGIWDDMVSCSDKTKPYAIRVRNDDSRYDSSLDHLQDLQAHYRAHPDPNVVVIDGAVDSLFLFDRNKQILNNYLMMNGLGHFQPKTWKHDLKNDSSPSIPKDIKYLVIKPSDGSLAKGLLFVPTEDLELVLTALRKSTLEGLNREQCEVYGEDLKYYFNPDEHQHVVIQEHRLGCFVKQEGKSYHATPRAVFSIIKENSLIKVELIDIFWQLAIDPIEQGIKRTSVISGKGYQRPKFNCWPSLNPSEREKIEPKLSLALHKISCLAYRQDIKEYLVALYKVGRFEEIRYFMNYYEHIRIERLDKELITILIRVEPELAKLFLINQAKRFALGNFLLEPQLELLNWIKENLGILKPSLRNTLKTYFESELKMLSEFDSNGFGMNRKDEDEKYRKLAKEFIDSIDKLAVSADTLVQYTNHEGSSPELSSFGLSGVVKEGLEITANKGKIT